MSGWVGGGAAEGAWETWVGSVKSLLASLLPSPGGGDKDERGARLSPLGGYKIKKEVASMRQSSAQV